jgi:hypothetical protein
MPVGLPALKIREQAIFHEAYAFSRWSSTFREICAPLTFEIPASILAHDSRTFIGHARLRYLPLKRVNAEPGQALVSSNVDGIWGTVA